MIPGPKELAVRGGRKGADQGLAEMNAEILGSNLWGRDGKSGTPERAAQNHKNRLRPNRSGYFPFFAYQSALMGVKLFPFSGRSSRAKMAVTGQTGTQAPQSIHSVGWIYNCVSLSKSASSLRG